MPDILRFDKYPPLLALKQVKHLLNQEMMVVVHEKPKGIPFRIMFNDGKITYGTEKRKVSPSNPKYQQCFEVLDTIGLSRMELSPVPKFLVHGYFVGIGDGATRYSHKTFYVTDIQNPHGKFMDFGQFTKFTDIIGFRTIPIAYHDPFNIGRINNVINHSRLTVDRKPTGAIMKLDPPARIKINGKEQYCMVDLTRESMRQEAVTEQKILDEMMQTLSDMPITKTMITKINRTLPPKLSVSEWQSQVIPRFIEMLGEKNEDLILYHMERLLELDDFTTKTGRELRKYIEETIVERFMEIGEKYYDQYTN